MIDRQAARPDASMRASARGKGEASLSATSPSVLRCRHAVSTCVDVGGHQSGSFTKILSPGCTAKPFSATRRTKTGAYVGLKARVVKSTSAASGRCTAGDCVRCRRFDAMTPALGEWTTVGSVASTCDYSLGADLMTLTIRVVSRQFGSRTGSRKFARRLGRVAPRSYLWNEGETSGLGSAQCAAWRFVRAEQRADDVVPLPGREDQRAAGPGSLAQTPISWQKRDRVVGAGFAEVVAALVASAAIESAPALQQPWRVRVRGSTRAGLRGAGACSPGMQWPAGQDEEMPRILRGVGIGHLGLDRHPVR